MTLLKFEMASFENFALSLKNPLIENHVFIEKIDKNM